MAVEGAATTNADYVLSTTDFTREQVDTVIGLVTRKVQGPDRQDVLMMLGLVPDTEEKS